MYMCADRMNYYGRYSSLYIQCFLNMEITSKIVVILHDSLSLNTMIFTEIIYSINYSCTINVTEHYIV